MKKVDFFIVGFAKSGTTALADFLNQHPDICMSEPKEPGYFAKDLIKESDEFHGKKVYKKARTMGEYENRFKHCSSSKLYGEATPIYIYSKVAAKNIYEYNPGAKIIILIRNPVDFLHALHMQYVNDGSEDATDFIKALEKEKSRTKNVKSASKYAVCPSLHFYSKRANYAEQILRYSKIFNKSNILFLTYDEFTKSNSASYVKVLRFLGIDNTSFTPDFSQINASRAPKSILLHRVLNNIYLKNLVFSLMSPQKYAKLRDNVARLVMSPQKRKPMDDGLRNRLIKQTRSDVIKSSKITNLPLDKIWGYE